MPVLQIAQADARRRALARAGDRGTLVPIGISKEKRPAVSSRPLRFTLCLLINFLGALAPWRLGGSIFRFVLLRVSAPLRLISVWFSWCHGALAANLWFCPGRA